jgi:putative pyruvate formate lyase activating enzyme
MTTKAKLDVSCRKEAAQKALKSCRLCPRNCGVDRTAGEKGFCGLGDKPRCFREMLHFGEESELTPSHQIYFAGCNLRCEFCTVSEWNEQPEAAEQMDTDWLVERIEYRISQGAKTINLLGGEPTVSLPGIIELAGHIDSRISVVLNSNMYYSSFVDELLGGIINIYLADLKCGNCGCAKKMLGAEDYVEVVRDNILKAYQRSDLIVRHLIMPGHFECCLKPTLNWLAKEMPDVNLSLRGDYVPPAEAKSAPKKYPTKQDIEKAVNYATKLGLNLIK